MGDSDMLDNHTEPHFWLYLPIKMTDEEALA